MIISPKTLLEMYLPLGNDASTHSLVDHDTQGVRRHVEHTTGLAVVSLVWHALLESAIALKTTNRINNRHKTHALLTNSNRE